MANQPVLEPQTDPRALQQRIADLEKHMAYYQIYEEILATYSQALVNDDEENVLKKILDPLLSALDASRVYVCENHRDLDDTLSLQQICEVHDPAKLPPGNNIIPLHITYQKGLSRWEDQLSKGNLIMGPVASFPDSERRILEPRHALSTIIVPLRMDNTWQGFLGVDETQEARKWDEADIRLLKTAAQMITSCIVHRKAETTRRESERLFHALIESLPQNIYSKDLEGRFIYANQHYCETQGRSLYNIVGKTDFDLHPPEMAKKYREDDFQVIKTGKMIELVEEHQPIGKEKFYVHVIKTPVYNAQGQITGTLGAFWDITELKRTEQKLENLLQKIREQAQQTQQIINTVPEGVILLDSEQRVILTNPIAARELPTLSGIKVGELLTHLGDHPLNELLTSPPKGLWHEVKADERTFQTIARPIETGPTTGGWVLIIRDVTREREIQQQVRQQERLASLGQLAAGIAHDFNNIMAVIVLYAQILQQTPEMASRSYERLETIQQQAQQATHLIQQILDFSRRAILERKPIDLCPFLKEAVKLLERTLPENINISLSYGDDDYTINADPTRIQQMIMNLAVNARDAMPKGGNLSIQLERIDGWVRLIVADTGTGISSEALPHIFEPFFTTKVPGQGTGLGLAQVYGIIKQHEGEIQVKSEVGEGTTFIITLPGLVQPVSTEPEKHAALVRGNGERVLVVEDNPTTREALTESLTWLGYQVRTAANGKEALEILAKQALTPQDSEQTINIVLSDVVMPDMGGIALLHALQERQIQVAFILITGHPMSEELETLKVHGLASWLTKPPGLEELAAALSEAVRQI